MGFGVIKEEDIVKRDKGKNLINEFLEKRKYLFGEKIW